MLKWKIKMGSFDHFCSSTGFIRALWIALTSHITKWRSVTLFKVLSVGLQFLCFWWTVNFTSFITIVLAIIWIKIWHSILSSSRKWLFNTMIEKSVTITLQPVFKLHWLSNLTFNHFLSLFLLFKYNITYLYTTNSCDLTSCSTMSYMKQLICQ